MTRIVLNPDQLNQTASVLDNAAGEYQAIGSQVCGCNCGCMPADVAAVVDSVTADVRGALQGISYELGAQASDLSQRAGVTQDGGNEMLVGGGGFDPAWSATGNGQINVGGYGFDPAWSQTGNGQTLVGGGGFDLTIYSDAGSGQTLVGGGGFDLLINSDAGSGQTLVGGGGFDPAWSATGNGQTLVGGGDFTIYSDYSQTDALAMLMGMAGARGDTFSQAMIWDIINRQNITTEMLTLPDGWRIEYGGVTYG